jgi:hypothetical protein
VPSTKVILDPGDVNEYLDDHKLTQGFVEFDTILFQERGTTTGAPCVLMAVEIDGKKHLVKTTLRLWLAIGQALDGAAKRVHGEHWRGP